MQTSYYYDEPETHAETHMSLHEFGAFLHTGWGAAFLFFLFFLGGLIALKGIHAGTKREGPGLFLFTVIALIILLCLALFEAVTVMTLGWWLALAGAIIGVVV